jgi:hypothetical protein
MTTCYPRRGGTTRRDRGLEEFQCLAVWADCPRIAPELPRADPERCAGRDHDCPRGRQRPAQRVARVEGRGDPDGGGAPRRQRAHRPRLRTVDARAREGRQHLPR